MFAELRELLRISEYPIVLFDVHYSVYNVGCRWFFGIALRN